ncbi:MAG: C10 family peptidase, partial [Muribaculaceae bacterium]|nr:C10 family peptidase [Muribaculaceae bacterium]
GISVDMSYTPQESAASSEMMCESLIKIFNYSQGLWLALRDYFGYDDWEDMIYGELAENRPVLYGGRGTAGGHQFICDGYSSDGFFHINWGWGGMSDGYFLLTALSPSSLGIGGGAGGFNTGQDAAIGVCPPKAGDKPVYIVFNTQGFTTSAATVNAGDTFRIEGLFINFSLVALPAGSKFGMKFTPADESEPIYSDSYDVSNLEPYNGYKSLPVIFPELENGTYKITPALYTEGEWSEIRMPVGKPSALTAVVNDKEATLSNSVAASVEIKDIEIRPVIYRDREFPMTFTVVNDSDEEYYGNVTPVLVDADGNVVAKSAYSPIDVLPGKEDVITTYVADFVAEENQEFTVGDYKLVFTDDSGKYISSPVDVKVEDMTAETKITVTDFKLDSENPVPSPENTQFSYKVACDSGIYYNSLDLIVFPGAGGYSVYSKPSERTYLEAGESADVKMTADMSNLEDGDYMAMMYEGQTSKTDRVYFKIKKVATGIEVIEVETEEVAIYDLNGVRRELPLSPGIYILKTGGESRKLVVK